MLKCSLSAFNPRGRSSCPRLETRDQRMTQRNRTKLTLLFPVFDTVPLVHARTVVRRVAAESNLKGRKEFVHASHQRLWSAPPESVHLQLVKCQKNVRRCGCRNGGLTLKHDDTVSKISCHDEIVLNDEGGLLSVENEPLDDFGCNDTLLRVQEPFTQQSVN